MATIAALRAGVYSLAGKQRKYSFKDIARMAGVSDGTVREAVQGRKGRSEKSRLERLAYVNERLSGFDVGDVPPTESDISSRAPVSGVMKIMEYDEDALKRPGIWVGSYDTPGQRAAKVLTVQACRNIVKQAAAKWGDSGEWVISFYGTFLDPAGHYAPWWEAEQEARGWFSRRTLAAVPIDTIALLDQQQANELAIMGDVTRFTAKDASRVRRESNKTYASRFASELTAYTWTAVYAIKISEAKRYDAKPS